MKNSKYFAKTLIILLLFAVFNCYADDITNKVFVKKDQNGKVIFRLEKIYRSGSEIMMVTSRTNLQGALVVTSRSYLVNGNLVMTESDENKDGTFETIAIYNPPTGDMEIFIRQPDGSVKPASTEILQTYKKQNAKISKFWNDLEKTSSKKDN